MGRVIMIVVDTLRPDHLSAYGYSRPTSPTLSRLARDEGVLFERAYAASSWTLPSVTSIFTSLYPNEHGVEDRGHALAPDVPTLAAAFSAQGWHTAAFVTHIYASSIFGLDQGFNEFHELSIDREFREGFQLRAEELNARVLPWLAEHAEEKYFLYLHYFDPHWDYDPPAPYDGMFTDPEYEGPASGKWAYLRDFIPTDRHMPADDLRHVIGLYDGEIRYTDTQLGALFNRLRELGLWEDTSLVVLSDHGEEFEEHGSVHHIRTLYEEVLRVPLIVKPAGGRHAQWRPRVSESVPTIDVGPTLLDLAGLGAPASFHGRSLVELMRAPGSNREVFARTVRHDAYTAAIVHGDLKLIRRFEAADQAARLYDLSKDPREQSPTVADEAGHALLTKRLSDYLGLGEVSRTDAVPVAMSPTQLKSLRALGYLN